MTFKRDKLEHEGNEPSEASSLKFINIPIILISVFVGFGISYLAMKTKDVSMTPGDSRTASATDEKTSGVAAAVDDLSAMLEKGKQVYTTTCQACHQATGAGIPGAFPPLAESEWVSGSPKRLAAIVLHGLQGEINVKGQKFQGVMPPFKDQLKPEDIAALATYVRNSFGNKASLVTVETVNQAIQATATQTTPWNGEAELNSQKWD